MIVSLLRFNQVISLLLASLTGLVFLGLASALGLILLAIFAVYFLVTENNLIKSLKNTGRFTNLEVRHHCISGLGILSLLTFGMAWAPQSFFNCLDVCHDVTGQQVTAGIITFAVGSVLLSLPIVKARHVR